MQLSFFNLDDPLLEQIKEEITHLDINTFTPVEALMKLNEIKRLLTKKKNAIVDLPEALSLFLLAPKVLRFLRIVFTLGRIINILMFFLAKSSLLFIELY